MTSFTTSFYGLTRRPRSLRFLRAFSRSGKLGNRLGIILLIAAVISGMSTYAALTATPPFGDDPNTVFWLLNLDLIILALLVIVIARRIINLWSGRRKGIAGSRLHVRLVLIFSILTAAPAIIMTVFSGFFMYFGVQSWFSERVRTAVNESQAVAEAYLEEHQQVIRADTLAMANDLDRQAAILIANPQAFDKVVETQSYLRNLSEAIIFDEEGQVLARSGITFTLAFETIPTYALAQAAEGDVVVMTGSGEDRVRALVKLNNFIDTYLFVGRMVDPTVLRHLADTRQAVEEYKKLEVQRSGLQITIMMIFIIVALVLLMAAIWFGLIYARQLVIPISALISAADRIRAGDLTARVPEFERRDEFDVLARTFNRMTDQIQGQRNELITANRQLDQRRRFTETVLAGVSSGIIGLDEHDRITIANSSAAKMFQTKASELDQKKITDILPEITEHLDAAHQKPGKVTQCEIPHIRDDGSRRTLLVRIAIEMIGEEDKGAVLTFDDITDLQLAQRKAAWADVARRIAHEIKNPLTPIQLSAERLKRKYLQQISEDPETFSKCTDTIIHHVGDIGRMVNEFSAFARMPEPVIKREDLLANVRDTLFLLKQAHPDITFNFSSDGPEHETVYAYFDAQQIRQALTNILQNAIDSVQARIKEQETAGQKAPDGEINIFVASIEENEETMIVVSDNGLGFPETENTTSLTEPYVTQKEKGTGLGLAIVKKIMDDHQGKLVLGVNEQLSNYKAWKNPGGATVILYLPLASPEESGSIATGQTSA